VPGEDEPGGGVAGAVLLAVFIIDEPPPQLNESSASTIDGRHRLAKLATDI